MTRPIGYERADATFEALLVALRDALGLTTTNQSFTTLEAVLVVFRRRLSPSQCLAFAAALPPLLRALFLEGWHANEHVAGFPEGAALDAEIRGLRPEHNFAPDGAAPIVAATLRRELGDAVLERALAGLPAEAKAFWGG